MYVSNATPIVPARSAGTSSSHAEPLCSICLEVVSVGACTCGGGGSPDAPVTVAGAPVSPCMQPHACACAWQIHVEMAFRTCNRVRLKMHSQSASVPKHLRLDRQEGFSSPFTSISFQLASLRTYGPKSMHVLWCMLRNGCLICLPHTRFSYLQAPAITASTRAVRRRMSHTSCGTRAAP